MTAASLDLTDGQHKMLLGYVTAVQSRPATRDRIQAAYVIVSAGIAESGLRNLGNPHVPESLKIPNDGLGYDHASIGGLQQQTGYHWVPAGYAPPATATMEQTTMDSPDGWGTPAQLMDPVYSANKFFEKMETVKDWLTSSPWVVAQAVQGSAYDGVPRKANDFSNVYGGNYYATYARAKQLVDAVWPSRDNPSGGGTPIGDSELDATERAMLTELYNRRGKTDKMFYALSIILPAVANIRGNVNNLVSGRRVGLTAPAGAVRTIDATPGLASSTFTSIIRTVVPGIAAFLLSLPVATPVEHMLGVDTLAATRTVSALITFVLFFLYYIIVRWLETQFPQFPLISLLLGSPSKPVYVPAGAEQATVIHTLPVVAPQHEAPVSDPAPVGDVSMDEAPLDDDPALQQIINASGTA